MLGHMVTGGHCMNMIERYTSKVADEEKLLENDKDIILEGGNGTI